MKVLFDFSPHVEGAEAMGLTTCARMCSDEQVYLSYVDGIPVFLMAII